MDTRHFRVMRLSGHPNVFTTCHAAIRVTRDVRTQRQFVSILPRAVDTRSAYSGAPIEGTPERCGTKPWSSSSRRGLYRHATAKTYQFLQPFTNQCQLEEITNASGTS